MRDDDGSTCGKPVDGGGEAAARDDGADTMMTTPAGKPADGGEAAMPMMMPAAVAVASGWRWRAVDRRGGRRRHPFFLFAVIFSQASESTSCENGDVACKNYFRRQAGGPYPRLEKLFLTMQKHFFY